MLAAILGTETPAGLCSAFDSSSRSPFTVYMVSGHSRHQNLLAAARGLEARNRLDCRAKPGSYIGLIGLNIAAVRRGRFSKLGFLLGPFFRRVPYYIGDPKRDPNLENYLCKLLVTRPEQPRLNCPSCESPDRWTGALAPAAQCMSSSLCLSG